MRRSRATLAALALLPARHGCAALSGTRLFSNVASKYAPLRKHADLFDPAKVGEWLHPDFVAAIAAIRDADVMGADPQALARDFVTEEAREIYSFPLLTDDACDLLMDEVEAFASSGL